MSDILFGIRLTADGSGFVGNVRIAREEIERLGQSARKAGDDVDKSGKQMKESLAGAVAVGTTLGQLFIEGARFLRDYTAETIRAAAELNDMRAATGSSINDLSALSNQFRISTGSSAGLSQALQRLAVGLSGADEESKQAGKALALLGIQARDPATAFLELAKKLDQYQDGANKAALVQAILGRGAQNLLPVLKDLAEKQTLVGTVTKEQAEKAQELEQAIRRLRVESTTLSDVLLSSVVPALAKFLEQWNAARGSGGSFAMSSGIAEMSAPEMRTKIDETTASLNRLVEARDRYQLFGNTGDAAKKQQEIDYLQRYLTALNAVWAKTQKTAAVNTAGWVSQEGEWGKPEAPKVPGAPPSAGAKEVDEYGKAVERLGKLAAEADLQLGALLSGEKATQAQKWLADLMASPAWGKLNQAQQQAVKNSAAIIAAKEREADATEKAFKHELEIDKHMGKVFEEAQARQKETVSSYAKLVEQINTEAETLGMTNVERERYVALKKLDKDYTDGLIPSEEKYLETVRQINDAFANLANREMLQQQKAAWKSAYEDIANTITDSIEAAFFDMKNAAKHLLDGLKQLFSQYVLRPVIQAVMAPISAGITSALVGGTAQAATGGAGGIGNIASLGSSLGSAFNAGAGGVFASGIGNAFATSSVGQALGLSAAGLDTAGGVALTSFGTGVGAAIPYVGIAIAAATLIKSYLDKKKGGPMTREYGLAGGDLGAFGGLSSLHKLVGTDAVTSSAYQQIAGEQLTSYASLVKALGGKGSAAFGIYSSQDPKGTAGNALDVRALVNGQAAYTANLEGLPRDSQALADRITLESKRAVFAALQHSDLPKQIAELFGRFTAQTMDAAAIDNLVAFGTAYGQVAEVLAKDPMADALAALNTESERATTAFRQQGEMLADLARQYDASAQASSDLAAATAGYYNSMVGMLGLLEQTKRAIDEMFTGSIRQYTLAGLDKQGQYDYLREDSKALFAQLQTATDADQIRRIASEINAEQTQAFGMLSPDEQRVIWRDFVDDAKKVNEVAQDRIAKAEEKTKETFNAFLKGVQEAMDAAATRFEAAAGQVADAAATIADAAGDIPTTVTLVNTGGTEIGGGSGA